MGRQAVLELPVSTRGKVNITSEQYREYVQLKRNRDALVESLRAQMAIQNSEALALAREVTAGLIGDTPLGVAIVNNKAAANAVERAQILLLTE